MQNESGALSFFLIVLKGVAAAVIFSLAAVLLFALIIKLFSLPSSVITPVNQAIKVLSVLLSSLVFIRGNKGFLKGILLGLFAVAATYFVFAAIGGGANFSWKFFVELLFGGIVGGIGGIIAVNVRK